MFGLKGMAVMKNTTFTPKSNIQTHQGGLDFEFIFCHFVTRHLLWKGQALWGECWYPRSKSGPATKRKSGASRKQEVNLIIVVY